MKNYYKVILGSKSKYSTEALSGSFIGADFKIDVDLTNRLPENWREFNKEFIPVYLAKNPERTKVAAGLSCGNLWVLCKGINIGDIVLSQNDKGAYMIGEVIGDYYYNPNNILPHRRKVKWYSKTIERTDMSDALQTTIKTLNIVSSITKHAAEIENLILGNKTVTISASDESIEDPSVFAMEKHLEEFLVKNWHYTEFGKDYKIYEEEGELVGQQYPTDTGNIDILAISKDKKQLLVIELKKGRVSDVVVGQLQRYMGYVKDELAEPGQTVKGIIIALEDDIRLRRALSVTNNIEFYKYQISFKLSKNIAQ
jgi:restriction system protein